MANKVFDIDSRVRDAEIEQDLFKLSRQIKIKRIRMNMNQKEFADFMGVSQVMISKWERGDYNFTIKSLYYICKKLNFPFVLNFEDFE